MTALRMWFLGIFAAALVLNILCSLVQKGTFGKLVNLLAGLTMVIVMLRPLCSWELRDIFSRYAFTEDHLQETIDGYRQDMLKEESAIIEEQTAAYIAKKAGAMDVICGAVVHCETVEGTPFPVSVSLDIPYHRGVSEMIAEELNIPRENQHWQGE